MNNFSHRLLLQSRKKEQLLHEVKLFGRRVPNPHSLALLYTNKSEILVIKSFFLTEICYKPKCTVQERTISLIKILTFLDYTAIISTTGLERVDKEIKYAP